MVLEFLLSPREAERQPLDAFVLGFGVSSIGVWLAYYIFPDGASAWFLFLIGIALEPLLLKLYYIEEKEDMLSKGSLFERHNEVILIYLFLFFGMIVAFSFWFTVLPNSITSVMFKDQIAEVARIQGLRTVLAGSLIAGGGALSGFVTTKITAAALSKGGLFKLILVNNMRLLFLFIAFAFLFGAGAVILLTWNAAVVGVAIGNLAKETITSTAHIFAKTTVYFTSLPFSFLSFFVHGIFEVLGYFIGAIAGGILSVAIARKHYHSSKFRIVLVDFAWLAVLSIGLILIGAFVEVYITPLL